MRFAVLILLLFLSACGTTTNNNYLQAVNSWRWGRGDTLLEVWGRPNKIARLPNKDLLFIYEKETYQSYPVSASADIPTYTNGANGNSVLVPSISTSPLPQNFLLRCITSFEVDQSDVIVSIHAQGNSCTGNKGFLLSKSNPHPVLRPQKKPKPPRWLR